MPFQPFLANGDGALPLQVGTALMHIQRFGICHAVEKEAVRRGRG
jgi:hypothetical protein